MAPRSLRSAITASAPPMTVAVLTDDDTAHVLIIGDDRRAFSNVSGFLSAAVERKPDHLVLVPRSGPRLHVDLEAELGLRIAKRILITFADEKGLTPSGVSLHLGWDHASVSCEKSNTN